MKVKKYIKNIKKRYIFKKVEIFQKVLKSLFLFTRFVVIKLVIQKLLFFNIPKLSFKTTIKDFCIISGRSRGIIKKLRVSRIIFKLLGEKGIFFGLKKAS